MLTSQTWLLLFSILSVLITLSGRSSPKDQPDGDNTSPRFSESSALHSSRKRRSGDSENLSPSTSVPMVQYKTTPTETSVSVHKRQAEDTCPHPTCPHRLLIVRQPEGASINGPLRQQPLIKVLQRKGKSEKNSKNAKWRISVCSKTSRHGNCTNDLQGTTEADVTEQLAQFRDLRFVRPGSSYYLEFRVTHADFKHIREVSNEFQVTDCPLVVMITKVSTRPMNGTYHLHGTVILKDPSTGKEASPESLTQWRYKVSLRYLDHFKGDVKCNSSSTPFLSQLELANCIISEWGFHYQVKVTAFTETWTIYNYSDPFDVLPSAFPREETLVTKTVRVKLSSGTYEEAVAQQNLLFTTILNDRQFCNERTICRSSSLNKVKDSPNLKWYLSGTKENVDRAVSEIWNKVHKGYSYQVANLTWALAKPMNLDGKQYLEKVTPPTPSPININGFPVMNIILIIVVAALVLPFCFLLIGWKRREAAILEKYYARVQQETGVEPPSSAPPPAKKEPPPNPYPNGHVNTAFADDDKDVRNIFTVEDHLRSQPKDAGETYYLKYNQIYPHPPCKWPPAVATTPIDGMVGLNISKLEETHRNFIDKGNGIHYSSSRCSCKPEERDSGEDAETCDNGFQEISFSPPMMVRRVRSHPTPSHTVDWVRGRHGADHNSDQDSQSSSGSIPRNLVSGNDTFRNKIQSAPSRTPPRAEGGTRIYVQRVLEPSALAPASARVSRESDHELPEPQ